MKKLKLSLSVIFLLFAIAATAQWNFNGNHIYNTNSGNVGIGIDTPNVPLDVLLETTGTGIRISSELEVGSARMYLTTTGSGGFYAMDETDVLNLMLRSKGSSFFKGGNIGIGTSTPTYLLDVAKNTTAPTIAVRNLGGAGGAGIRIFDQASSSDWHLKTTSTGTFRLRDQQNGQNVIEIENNSQTNSLYIQQSGNIGMGTSSPSSLLEVAKSTIGPLIVIHNLGGLGGAGFSMIDDLNNGSWKFKSAAAGGFKIRDHASSMDVFVIEKNAMANAIYVQAGGNIGIGTSTPGSKLAVNGKIDCKEVEIYITGWSDFVFDEGYQLKPLNDLENYIKENKHLPGVPTEKEAIENGISVGKMNAVLLEKIEELTLYVIDLKKENDKMKKEINDLKDK